MSDAVIVRGIKTEDVKEVVDLIESVMKGVLVEERKETVKRLLKHPWFYFVFFLSWCCVTIACPQLSAQNSLSACVCLTIIEEYWRFTRYWQKLGAIQFNEETVKNKIKNYTRPSRSFDVAVVKGRVVGTLAYRQVDLDDQRKTLKLKSLYVHPSFRRQGIASTLLMKVYREAKEKGYGKIILRTHSSNFSALNLYTRHGFIPTNKQNHVKFFPHFMDVVQLELYTDNH